MVKATGKSRKSKTLVKPAAIVRDDKETTFVDALSERYLAYAMSTITSRSLPDVRDGLKPVHRRLLYAMQQLRLDPTSGYKKCARVVGDVIGKFHPHGDQAVYGTLVRLAQDFSVRYPLVDGQGNFGNIDGDNAAAMRYTEARLTGVADAMMAGLGENAVDFRETYDGSEDEPTVMPSGFPNLLANGSSGIAVGMATNIPSHNVGEVCNALLHLIKFPKATIKKLLEFIPGPDFPTGAILAESPATVRDAYATGRGSMRVRARWEKEDTGHGTWQIVVRELPYQVLKARLIERIADLINQRKLSLLEDVRDESADDMRLVLTPRSRDVDPGQLMELLYRSTDLETRFSLNMNVLDSGQKPQLMNLREVLQAFLDHRLDVLIRRSKFRLEKIEHRLEVLEGYLVAYKNLNKIIRIIRDSDEPKPLLVKTLKLTDLQAESILNMRLRALRRLEESQIKQEHGALGTEQQSIRSLLKDDAKRWKAVAQEVAQISKDFGLKTDLGRRRTEIGSMPLAVVVPIESLVEKESITVICSSKCWIRAVKGHAEPTGAEKYKEGDEARFWVHAETTDKLVLFSTNGRFYTIGCERITRGRGHGEPLRILVDLPDNEDLVALFVHRPGRRILVVSADGRGFIVPEEKVVAQTKVGKQVLNLKEGVRAAVCTPAEGDRLALIGTNRKIVIFPLEEVPELIRGRGVTLQRYRDGSLSDAICFDSSNGLTWHLGSRRHTATETELWEGRRGNAGRLAPRGFPRTNRFTL